MSGLKGFSARTLDELLKSIAKTIDQVNAAASDAVDLDASGQLIRVLETAASELEDVASELEEQSYENCPGCGLQPGHAESPLEACDDMDGCGFIRMENARVLGIGAADKRAACDQAKGVMV